MLVAAIGVLINGATALLFVKGRERDLNIKGAFLHMAADAGVSAGVIIAGLAINLTGAQWIDPTVSLLIVVVIAIGTWGLLRDSLNLSLDAVPREIDPTAVENYLLALPGVTKVHDLHIWAMSTTETALTAHLVKPAAEIDDANTRAHLRRATSSIWNRSRHDTIGKGRDFMPAGVASNSLGLDNRARDLQLALLLTYITIGWMTIEGAAALLLGWASKSLLLEAFGIDSVIELFSAAVLLWRLRVEASGAATFEHVDAR